MRIVKKGMVAVLGLAMLFSANSSAYFEYCKNYKNTLKEAAGYFNSIIPIDLLKYLETETSLVMRGTKSDDPSFAIVNKTIDAFKSQGRPLTSLTVSEVRKELTEQTLTMLDKYRPDDPYDRRLDFLTEDIVKAVLRSIENHPIVSTSGMRKYDQKGTNIGYCFGRAAYVDLILARLGVDQDSVKKIWAVGPMNSGSINWQFHVGTLVRLKDNRWVVIDNVVGKIIEARDWYKFFLVENEGKNLRAYITDSNKFTPSLGTYSRMQLGLDLLPTRDWYQGYFTDLMAWFKHMKNDDDLATFLGIAKIPDRPLTAAALASMVASQQAENAAKLAKDEETRREDLAKAFGIDFTVGNVDD